MSRVLDHILTAFTHHDARMGSGLDLAKLPITTAC